MRLVAVSGLLNWDSLIAYSFHYDNEQEVELIEKYSMRLMRLIYGGRKLLWRPLCMTSVISLIYISNLTLFLNKHDYLMSLTLF